MAIFRFEKRGASNWWHWNGITQILNFSNWEIVFDEVSQSVNLQQLNGANVPITQVPIADVRVKNLSGSDETFVTVELLRARLVALGYNPLVTSGGGGSQNLAEVLAIGGREAVILEDNAYTFVEADKTKYITFTGDNTENVVVDIPIGIFVAGDSLKGVAGIPDFSLIIDNTSQYINPDTETSFTLNYLDEFELTCIQDNIFILSVTRYNNIGGGIPDAPNDANAYIRSGLAWVIGYTKSAIDTLLGNKQNTLTESVLGTFLNGLTAKNTLIDADLVSSVDTADSNKAKKTTWLNVWTNYLKPKIDAIFGLYAKKTRIFLTADASNNTVADIDITSFTFTLPPSTSCDFRVCLPFTSAAVSTGINTTVKVTTGIGANGNILGNVFTKTRLSATTTSPIINVVDQGANATVGYSALSGVSTAGLSNVVEINCDLNNLATNTSATVVIAFASEVGGSNIDVKRGSSMVIDI